MIRENLLITTQSTCSQSVTVEADAWGAGAVKEDSVACLYLCPFWSTYCHPLGNSKPWKSSEDFFVFGKKYTGLSHNSSLVKDIFNTQIVRLQKG